MNKITQLSSDRSLTSTIDNVHNAVKFASN